MPFERTYQRLADDGEASSTFDTALQKIFSVAAPAYGAGALINRYLHDLGVKDRESLAATVFSVGNITQGGTGKTPFTIWLARWLASEGKAPAVLSRGYGRKDESKLVVVHDGKRLRAKPETGGDEPVLIAKALKNTPVVVCADRVRAGRLALKKFDVSSFVLDDGFQHHHLDRQAEIVLLDSTKPLDKLKLIPRGTLREPLSVLKRAHLIVLTRCDQADTLRRFAHSVKRYAPQATICRTYLALTGYRRLSDGKVFPKDEFNGETIVVYCGVGNPGAVRRTVERSGAIVSDFHAANDHAKITEKVLKRLERMRKSGRASGILVTEKDAVKMRGLKSLPTNVYEIQAEMKFVAPRDRDLAEKALRARLHAKKTRGFLK